MYMCIVSNTYRIGKVRIEYVSYRLLTVSSQPYIVTNVLCWYTCNIVWHCFGILQRSLESMSSFWSKMLGCWKSGFCVALGRFMFIIYILEFWVIVRNYFNVKLENLIIYTYIKCYNISKFVFNKLPHLVMKLLILNSFIISHDDRTNAFNYSIACMVARQITRQLLCVFVCTRLLFVKLI